jgi:chromosome segregation protein
LKDIQEEVQKEIRHLATQAARASEYKALKEKGERRHREWLSLKIASLTTKQQKEEGALAAQVESNRKEEERLQELRKALREEREGLDRQETLLREKEKTLYQVKSSLEVKEKELETVKERLNEVERTSQRIKKGGEEIESARKEREKDKEAYLVRQKALSSDLEKETKALKNKEDSLLASQLKVEESRKALEKVQENLLKLTRENNVVSSEMKQKSVRYEASLEKLGHAEKEIKRLKELLSGVEKEEGEKTEALAAASRTVDEVKGAFDHLDKEIKSLAIDLVHAEKEAEEAAASLMASKAREKVLLKLREEMEGAQEGTKALLKEAKRKGSPLFEKLKGLWECFEIEKGYEAALDAALRPYSDTLVAESESAYEAILAYAESKSLQDFSLVWIPPEKSKAMKNSLAKRVKSHPAADHFLGETAVFETRALAQEAQKEHPGLEVFSLDGFFRDRFGVAFKISQKTQSLFLREAELKALQEEIALFEADASLKRGALEKLKNLRQETVEKRSIRDKELRASEMALVEKNYQLQRVKGERERAEVALKKFEEEREKGLQEQKVLEGEIALLQTKSQSEEGSLRLLTEEKNGWLFALEKNEAEFKEKTARFKDEKHLFTVKTDETRKILYALNLIDVKEQESVAQERKLADEAKELKELKILLEAKEKDLTGLSRDGIGDAARLEAVKKAFEEELSQKRAEVKKQEETLSRADEAAKAALEKTKGVEIKLAQITTQLEGVRSEFYELWPDEELLSSSLTEAEAEKEVKAIKKELEGYKDINLAAPESLQQHSERAQDLEKEIGDLLGSSDELRGIIGKLEGESRTLFQETFEAVRENFKRNFSILFNGGEADLELTESDDLLKAGIEIVAKPPGKQMRSLSLLSGGEKCLTAMALLFSLFEVKAAPFCLLDEIDAPLDDTNVGRFTEMVKHFVDRSQFIIITHNKRTMSMGDRLYGVSMEEKGVSKILSMEFEKEASRPPKEVVLV